MTVDGDAIEHHRRSSGRIYRAWTTVSVGIGRLAYERQSVNAG